MNSHITIETHYHSFFPPSLNNPLERSTKPATRAKFRMDSGPCRRLVNALKSSSRLGMLNAEEYKKSPVMDDKNIENLRKITYDHNLPEINFFGFRIE